MQRISESMVYAVRAALSVFENKTAEKESDVKCQFQCEEQNKVRFR